MCRRREAPLDRAHAGGVSVAHSVEQRTTGEPERAEAHEDRTIEPCGAGEPGVRVDAVVVVGREPVEERLGRRGLVRHDSVRRAIGSRPSRGRLARTVTMRIAEPAESAQEERRVIGEPGCSRRRVDRLPFGHHERA